MNADEIVKALREPKCGTPDSNGKYECNKVMASAADLIESLQVQRIESQRREQEAVEDLEWLMLRENGADCCTLCEHDHTHDGPCAGQSTKCDPKWRGPQETGKEAEI